MAGVTSGESGLEPSSPGTALRMRCVWAWVTAASLGQMRCRWPTFATDARSIRPHSRTRRATALNGSLRQKCEVSSRTAPGSRQLAADNRQVLAADWPVDHHAQPAQRGEGVDRAPIAAGTVVIEHEHGQQLPTASSAFARMARSLRCRSRKPGGSTGLPAKP